MKRKIKDFNDFLECIKAGKKVTAENGYWTYFLSDGYICESCVDLKSYNIHINDIDLEDMEVEVEVEVEEQEHFTIEVGKFYRTREGKKAYCFRSQPKTEDIKEINSFVIDNEGIITTDDRGKTFRLAPDEHDIVGYWEDK